MKKVLSILLIIMMGCLIAGIYGVIHDQLTYTISPEYYTKFKFDQFGFAYDGNEGILDHPRLYVSFVGFLATWWMGIPIATTLGLVSLHPDARTMIRLTMNGFVVTLIIAFLVGLYGLYNGFADLAYQPRENFEGWFIPDNLTDFKSFIAVGSMHNYSYLGGSYSLLGGIVYIVWKKYRSNLMGKAS
jgi:hypothetical protein